MRKTISLIAFGVASCIGAAAQAQAPSWNGPYQEPPRGSYVQSCREITTFSGNVYARCQTKDGRWAWTGAHLRDCNNQGLANAGDGRLICQSLVGGGGGGGGGFPGGGGGGRPGGGGNPYRADAVLFEHAGYEGNAYEVRGDMPDLTAIKFNDVASSIKVMRGEWQVCENTNYEGRCWTLTRDEGLLGRELNDKISSIRRVR
ncbi:beta/gamma crystallin-related protein [Caulobacter sp. ErkDOM-YI]|uniref:beta/gamma crystallin-related protein n=1 Tax=unclassified Caulobacter TaxID=2648921 RepID=UPI003AF4D3FA